MTEPYLFWLGADAESAAAEVETYEQLLRELPALDEADCDD